MKEIINLKEKQFINSFVELRLNHGMNTNDQNEVQLLINDCLKIININFLDYRLAVKEYIKHMLIVDSLKEENHSEKRRNTRLIAVIKMLVEHSISFTYDNEKIIADLVYTQDGKTDVDKVDVTNYNKFELLNWLGYELDEDDWT